MKLFVIPYRISASLTVEAALELVEDLVALLQGVDVLPDTGTDQVILEPAVGALDLALGLRGESVEGLDAAFV